MGKHLLSIIIPAKNEEKTIKNTISVAKKCFPNIQKEIIVVAANPLTEKAIKKEGVVVLRQKDKGKGNAMKLGFGNSSGEIVVFSDADIQNLEKSWIEKIVKPILDNKADVVLGWCRSPYFKVATETVYKPLMELLFPEVKKKISFEKESLTGQRAFKRPILSKLDLFPNFGVETAMNIDLTFLKPPTRIKEVFLGEKLEAYKGSTFMVQEIVEVIIAKAKEYNRFSRIKERNYVEAIKLFSRTIEKALNP
jgi:glycosyltransferase involved in cell wall biosynthesis